MKFVHIVGARPQFIKYFPIYRVVNEVRKQHPGFEHALIHTGQHYDHGMSQIFFEELGIPVPALNLGVRSASHGKQTGRMLIEIEKALVHIRPQWVVVYGDTNSTLAGALAAVKLGLPVAHVEAGLRSYNRQMPEEINRVLADHVSELLFCPTALPVTNLAAEGITKGVHLVGDVMYDALLHYSTIAETQSNVLTRLGLSPAAYILLTLHRPVNTDLPDALKGIFAALRSLEQFTFVFPVHPRTKKAIERSRLELPKNVVLTDPVGYIDMLALERNATVILTDSGGVQKEAYLLKVPCITLREETEWKETVETGWNVLVGSDTKRIVEALENFKPPGDWFPAFGEGNAAEKIVRILHES